MTVEQFMTSLLTNFPQLGVSVLFIVIAINLFNQLMKWVDRMITNLQDRVKTLEYENKELRQALFSIQDPDKIRLATALLARSPQTNLGSD